MKRHSPWVFVSISGSEAPEGTFAHSVLVRIYARCLLQAVLVSTLALVMFVRGYVCGWALVYGVVCRGRVLNGSVWRLDRAWF